VLGDPRAKQQVGFGPTLVDLLAGYVALRAHSVGWASSLIHSTGSDWHTSHTRYARLVPSQVLQTEEPMTQTRRFNAVSASQGSRRAGPGLHVMAYHVMIALGFYYMLPCIARQANAHGAHNPQCE
jgi:hypothetical protein